ncbi:MAG: glycosyltransferase family 39 protein [Holophagae bacterium]
MSSPAARPRWSTAGLWLVAAVVLWLGASLVDRRTEVIIDTLGDRVRCAVGGTEVVVRDSVRSAKRLTLRAADSVQTPRLLRWTLRTGDRTTELPTGQRRPPTTLAAAPVGDWWVDDRVPTTVIAERAIDVDGAMAVTAELSGRFSKEVELVLGGDPTVRLGARRGLMDNYLAVRDAERTLVEVTTLDPTPGSDLGALAAQVLRGVAAGCLLISFIAFIGAVRPTEGNPPSEHPDDTATRAGPSRMVIGTAVAVLALAGLITSGWVAVDVLGGLPHQIDGVVYLLQARWLLDGEVAPAASAIQDHLRVPFTYLIGGHWIGHYPVGWPALLALGLLVGAPQLVNPVLGALLIVVVFAVGRELDGTATGLVAAVLATTSPLLRLLSGSMFPHIACAVLTVVALWLVLLAERRRGWWWSAGAGAALGLCLAIRPLSAVMTAVALGAWLLIRATGDQHGRGVRSTILPAIAGGVIASLPTLLHNAVVTGRPFALPYSLADGSMYSARLVPFGIRNLDAIGVSLWSSLDGWGWPLLTGGVALALPLGIIAVPFLLRRSRPEDWLLLAVIAVVAIGHLPTRAHGLHGYGARYAVDVAGLLVLLSARGFRELIRRARPSPAAGKAVLTIFVLLTVTAAATLPGRLALYRGYYGVTGELERQLAASGVDRAVILVDDDDWQPWGEAARIMTGARRHDIVIAADLGDTSVIERVYPDRPVLRWDGEHLHLDHGGDR